MARTPTPADFLPLERLIARARISPPAGHQGEALADPLLDMIALLTSLPMPSGHTGHDLGAMFSAVAGEIRTTEYATDTVEETIAFFERELGQLGWKSLTGTEAHFVGPNPGQFTELDFTRGAESLHLLVARLPGTATAAQKSRLEFRLNRAREANVLPARVPVLALGGTPARPPSAVPLPVGKIAWACGGPRLLTAVCTMNSNGSEARVIAQDANFPAWSPDGQWIAYYSDRQLFVANADGGAARPLAEWNVEPGEPDPAPPAWSPDSRAVAVVSRQGPPPSTSGRATIVHIDGSTILRLDGAGAVAWAPDSVEIASPTPNGFQVFDTLAFEQRRTIPRPLSAIRDDRGTPFVEGVVWLPTGHIAYIDGDLVVLDPRDGTVARSHDPAGNYYLRPVGPISPMKVSRDGRCVLARFQPLPISERKTPRLRIGCFDGQTIKTFDVGEVAPMAWAGNSVTVIVMRPDGTSWLFNRDAGTFTPFALYAGYTSSGSVIHWYPLG